MSTTDEVIAIVAAQLQRDPSELTPDTDLQEAGLESIDVIETVFALEEKFDIDVSFNANSDSVAFSTVRDVVTLVEAQLARKSAAG